MTITEMEIPEIESENIIEKKMVEVPLWCFQLLSLCTIVILISTVVMFSSLEFIDSELKNHGKRLEWIGETMAPGMFSRLDQVIRDSKDRHTSISTKLEDIQGDFKWIPKKVIQEINQKEYCSDKVKGNKELIEMCLESLD